MKIFDADFDFPEHVTPATHNVHDSYTLVDNHYVCDDPWALFSGRGREDMASLRSQFRKGLEDPTDPPFGNRYYDSEWLAKCAAIEMVTWHRDKYLALEYGTSETQLKGVLITDGYPLIAKAFRADSSNARARYNL